MKQSAFKDLLVINWQWTMQRFALTPQQKIDFANNFQLSLTLAAMSIGLWWLFDRSRSGFGLGVGIAVLATFVTQLLVYHGVYR